MINSLAPGRYGSNLKIIIFKVITQNCSWRTFCEIVLTWMPQNQTNEIATLIGSGNGLVPSGNKSLFWVIVDWDLCHHMVSLGHNEFTTDKGTMDRHNSNSSSWHFWNFQVLIKAIILTKNNIIQCNYMVSLGQNELIIHYGSAALAGELNHKDDSYTAYFRAVPTVM